MLPQSYISTGLPHREILKLEPYDTFNLSSEEKKTAVLTFFCMSLSVRSHWKICGGLKPGDPFMDKLLAEDLDLPAEWKW